MSLAQRVRDFRYSKGWGPDELASRAEISRTALYQIESGKTGLPRAGTLRRIAVALEVPMEDLLGSEGNSHPLSPVGEPAHSGRPLKAHFGWVAAEGGPLNLPSATNFAGLPVATTEETHFSVDALPKAKTPSPESAFIREGELMAKLHDLIHSPMGESITRIVDELHGLLARIR
jgi:transcriptional regulator with XRE-family HTH domain